MDTLCRVCIEKVAKRTSLSSKIEDSSNLSFFDFLNKCTILNAREGDSLPQSLCSVCDNAMRMFYSFTKQAEKSDLILREALKKLVAEARYNGHKETPSEESAKRKEIMPTKNSTRSSVYILDFVKVRVNNKNISQSLKKSPKEESRVSDSTSIVAVKQVGINESEHFESSLNHPEESNEEPDDILSCIGRLLESIDEAELTDSEDDIPTSALKRKLAKREDEADSQRNSCEEITTKHETIGEEFEDFNQDDSFHCQPSKNSTGSLSFILKEEPRVSERTSIVYVKDAVINESENLKSNLDNPKGSVEELDDVLSCISRPASIDTEHADSEDDLPMSLLKKRLAKNGDEADSQRNCREEITSKETTWHRCKLCGKKFRRKKNLNNHLQNHKGIQKCDKCGKEFENIYRLRQHLNTHADLLKHIKCEQCGKEFKHRESLSRHMKLHNNPKPFMCEICGRLFSRKDCYTSHMELCHKAIKHECDKCGKELKNRKTLNSHMKLHNNPEAFMCESCGKWLFSKESYARHMDTVHPEQSEKSKNECGICGNNFSTKNYLDIHMEKQHKGITRKCDKCGKEFTNKLSLNRHMKWHNNPEACKCEICGKSLSSKRSYARHRYSRHRNLCYSEQSENGCGICGENFFTKYYLSAHMEKQHKGIKQKCDKCGKEFTNNFSLSNHMKWHNNIEAFKCEICGKSLCNKESYTMHMHLCNPQQLDKTKNYCGICGKSLSTKYYLNAHMESHQGIIRKCDKCGKEFKHRESLRKHMKWHNNPEACKCEICGKSLSSKRSAHMEKQHKGIKQKCDKCGKEFTNNFSLSNHMKWHNNIEAFKCEICGKSLYNKESYTMHMNLCNPQQLDKTKNYCGICGKSLSTKYYLNAHMESHQGIIRKCDKCGKEFKHRESLRKHMRLHNNPFKCEKCGRLFDRIYNYNSHIKICKYGVKQEQLKTKPLPIRNKMKEVVGFYMSTCL